VLFGCLYDVLLGCWVNDCLSLLVVVLRVVLVDCLFLLCLVMCLRVCCLVLVFVFVCCVDCALLGGLVVCLANLCVMVVCIYVVCLWWVLRVCGFGLLSGLWFVAVGVWVWVDCCFVYF